jgi:hypothetical protein
VRWSLFLSYIIILYGTHAYVCHELAADSSANLIPKGMSDGQAAHGAVSIRPGETLNPKKPFATKFVIHNGESSEISDIRCDFLWTYNLPDTVFSVGGGAKGGNFEFHEQHEYHWRVGEFAIPEKIHASADFTVSLNFRPGLALVTMIPTGTPITRSDGLPLSTNSVLLQIACRYKPSLSSTSKVDWFKFYAEPDKDANFHWFSLGYGPPWAMTNMPKVSVSGLGPDPFTGNSSQHRDSPKTYQLLPPETVALVTKKLQESHNHKVALLIHAFDPDESAYEFSQQLDQIFMAGGYLKFLGRPPASAPEVPGVSCLLYGGASADNAGLLEALSIILNETGSRPQISLMPGDDNPWFTNPVVVVLIRRK